MNNKIETERNKFEISQTDAEDKQEWRKHLYFISSYPNRLVGIIDDEDPGKLLAGGRSVKMYGTLMYIAELVFQPVVEVDERGQPRLDPETKRPVVVGVQGGVKLQLLSPYDFLGTPTIEITQAQYIMHASELEPNMRGWLYSEYLRVFDPPRIVR